MTPKVSNLPTTLRITKRKSNRPIGQYFYDGDGKRVKKIPSTETMIFVYDASSQIVAEYLIA